MLRDVLVDVKLGTVQACRPHALVGTTGKGPVHPPTFSRKRPQWTAVYCDFVENCNFVAFNLKVPPIF